MEIIVAMKLSILVVALLAASAVAWDYTGKSGARVLAVVVRRRGGMGGMFVTLSNFYFCMLGVRLWTGEVGEWADDERC